MAVDRAGEYTPEQAKNLFNADWAAASVLNVASQFSTRYREATLLALHKTGKADAYAILLCDEPDRAKALVREAPRALYFG